MLNGKMVRIRFRRDVAIPGSWVFLGKVVHFSESWVAVDGKGILIFRRGAINKGETVVRGDAILKGQVAEGSGVPADIDKQRRVLLFPREVISNIRVLPDNFDIDDMRVVLNGQRIDLVVEGAPNTSLDEVAEG